MTGPTQSCCQAHWELSCASAEGPSASLPVPASARLLAKYKVLTVSSLAPLSPTDANSPRTVPMALLGGPVSVAATRFVDRLLAEVVEPAITTQKRASSQHKRRIAVGALLADLFDFQRDLGDGKPPKVGAHGMSAGSFRQNELGFAYDTFKASLGTLEAAGLVERVAGLARWAVHFGKVMNIRGVQTRFRATASLIALGEASGVHVAAWQDHWCRVRPGTVAPQSSSPLLILRAEKVREKGKPKAAADLTFAPEDATPKRRIKEVSALNDYLAAQDIGGLSFPGLCRIFSNGDRPGFAWDQGGRFYSRRGGHRYEHWGAAKRCADITLNGEAVGEVDISASHLTLFHALLDQPFNAQHDPYDIEDIPRAVVKAWVAQALGSRNARPFQWSKTATAEYESELPGLELRDRYPVREVGAAVTDKHPALIDLKTSGLSTLTLQFHEAEILRLAMEDLMLRQHVPVLPIHDALIAPRSKLGLAEEAIVRAFNEYVGGVIGHRPQVIPKVTHKQL